MKPIIATLAALGMLLTACASVDLEAPVPVFDTSVDVEAWAAVPAGEFLYGQFSDPVVVDYDYEIMVTDVTVALHLNDLLKNISAVGNDLRFVPFGGVIGAPTIRVDGVTIAGR